MSLTKIATVTVGAGGAASIDFTSISGAFTDLMVVVSSITATANASTLINLNGVSTNLSQRALIGFGSDGLMSNSGSTGAVGSYRTGTANTPGSISIYIPNYAGSTNKSFSADFVSEQNAGPGYLFITAGLWSSTAAITSVSLKLDSSATYSQYSTATLYGVKSGQSGTTTVS